MWVQFSGARRLSKKFLNKFFLTYHCPEQGHVQDKILRVCKLKYDGLSLNSSMTTHKCCLNDFISLNLRILIKMRISILLSSLDCCDDYLG